MKKISTEQAQELFDRIDLFDNETVQIKLQVGLDEFKCSILKYLSAGDAKTISQEILAAAFSDGHYNQNYFDFFMAKCVIDYLTDMPVPMVKNNDGEDSTVDLNKCVKLFDLILAAIGDEEVQSIEYLDWFAVNECDARDFSPLEQLSKRILELENIITTTISDLLNNPATQAEFIEKYSNVPLSNIASVDELKKAFDLIK